MGKVVRKGEEDTFMKVRIGVDGGGTKTEVVAVDQKGRVLNNLRKPASNYHVVGAERAVQHIIEGITETINMINILPDGLLEGIGVTLAGIDTSEDWSIMAGGLRQGFIKLTGKIGLPFGEIPIILENDAFGALMSVRGEFSGNVLVAGTGAIALGINKLGDIIRVGGWGHLIGDQGAGYDIGRRALSAMVASFDGFGPKTKLEAKIIEYLGLAQVREISDWLFMQKQVNKAVAALVPVVVASAQVGDLVAKQILEESGRALGLLTKALVRKTKISEVGLVGGIGHIWQLIEKSFFTAVREEFPDLQILQANFSPSVGAALLSRISQVRHIEFSKELD